MVHRLIRAAVTVGTVAALAGCSGGEAEKSSDYPYVELGGATKPTAPGTELTFGEAAWLDPQRDGWGGPDPDTGRWSPDGPVGVTVRDLYPLDKSHWETYRDPEEFAGTTPYVVVAQFDYSQTSVESEEGYQTPATSQPPLLAAYADGKPTQFVASFGGGAVSFSPRDCGGRTVPAWDEEPGNQRYVACALFAVDDGKEPSQVVYTTQQGGVADIDPTMGQAGVSPYVARPLVWTR